MKYSPESGQFDLQDNKKVKKAAKNAEAEHVCDCNHFTYCVLHVLLLHYSHLTFIQSHQLTLSGTPLLSLTLYESPHRSQGVV